MGRKSRPAPPRMGEKLTAIRTYLSISQAEMLTLVKPGINKSQRAIVSEYERGAKVPDYAALLRYARLVGVSTDVLIDDKLQLRLPNRDDDGQSSRQNSSTASCICASPTPHLTPGEKEPLTVYAPAGFLDLLDDIYLDLLRCTPRLLRPPLTKDFFCQALIVVAVTDYLKYTDADTLASGWQRLTSRRRSSADDG